MSQKIATEQAIMEWESWLEFKKISDKQRSANVESEELIITEIEEGRMVLNLDNHEFTYKLKFPVLDIKGDAILSELVFKPRIDMSLIHNKLKAVKSTDADGRVFAHTAAITSQSYNYIRKLDTEDNRVCSSIVVYFL